MAIKPYVKDGQTCYLIRCVSKGRVAGVEGRIQKDLGAVTRTEAQREHQILKKEALHRRLVKERCGLTWRGLTDAWYRKVVVNGNQSSTTTYLDAYNSLLKHTKPWMALPVDQLRPLSMKQVFDEMTEAGLSKSRLKTIRGAVNTVFDWAVMTRLLPAHFDSPGRGVSLPRGESKKQPILNREEIRLVLRKARELNHEYFYLWAVAVNTGCRSGELWALRWTDVDFDRRLLSIAKSFNKRTGKNKATKSDQWRDVPISPQLEALLKELKLKTGQTGYVLPRITSWRRGEASKATRKFCAAVGVTEINFHSTRACFAVQCLEAGLGVATTMKIGGWTSIKAFQYYIRLSATEVRGATDKLDLIPSAPGNASVLELRSLNV
jgi:integrase